MQVANITSELNPALAQTIETKGFTDLTPVQQAVLDPAIAGRDLRISSQTGSGKTLALGFALQTDLCAIEGPRGRDAGPLALVITPTRELAKQVEEELTWLYAKTRARVTSVTGGASYRDEQRALATSPALIVGTPGRLLDHIKRGSIDTKAVGTVVLDEADRMLDMGFREDLESILGSLPKEHRTHLVSATFSRDVRSLADRVQSEPVHVQGTKLGEANADIEHVIHLVHPRERLAAIINLLLSDPNAQTLVFARTRADVADLAKELSRAHFRVDSLSGEMEQRHRNRALGAFKRGELDVLIATDVAARGIDVQDIARVIHAEPPTDSESYTHRSGRTGRAGRKGISSVLTAPGALPRTIQLLRRAGVAHRVEPIPTADEVRRLADERLFEDLTKDDPEGFPGFDNHIWSLAKQLAATENGTRVVARLLMRSGYPGPTSPREVNPIASPKEASRAQRPAAEGRREDRNRNENRGWTSREGGREATRNAHQDGGPIVRWIFFRVSVGQEQGADPRRLLAMLCRRGGIKNTDVGAIRIARRHSVVQIAESAANAFADAVRKADPRDPNVTIRHEREEGMQASHPEPRPHPQPAKAKPQKHEPRAVKPEHRDRSERGERGERGGKLPPKRRAPAKTR